MKRNGDEREISESSEDVKELVSNEKIVEGWRIGQSDIEKQLVKGKRENRSEGEDEGEKCE